MTEDSMVVLCVFCIINITIIVRQCIVLESHNYYDYYTGNVAPDIIYLITS